MIGKVIQFKHSGAIFKIIECTSSKIPGEIRYRIKLIKECRGSPIGYESYVSERNIQSNNNIVFLSGYGTKLWEIMNS